VKRVLQISPSVRLTLVATICLLAFLAIVGVRFIGLVFAADPGLTPQTLEVIPYGATDYRFSTYGLGEVPSDYGLETFDDSAFAAGNASFGSGGGCPLQPTVKTYWPVNSEIVLRKNFDLPPGATNLRVMVVIDNDVDVFLNGVDISGGLVQHENCPVADEFRFDAPDSILKAGNNLLAVRGRDRGVESYLDLRVLVEVPEPTSTPTVTPVPPTPTFTCTPTATNTWTPVPTDTWTPTPTDTWTPTPTFTPVPPTPTDTWTPTPTDTDTPTPTFTPVPPTPTFTYTPTNTWTPSPTSTSTLVPPTSTATSTPTVTPTGTVIGSGGTATPIPTVTRTIVPTATLTPTSSSTPGTPPPPSPTGVSMMKDAQVNVPGVQDTANLWVMKSCVDPTKGEGCLEIDEVISGIADVCNSNDIGCTVPEGLGAWEHEIFWDKQFVSISTTPDNTWLTSGGRVFPPNGCFVTIVNESDLLEVCVTKDTNPPTGAVGPEGAGVVERITITPNVQNLMQAYNMRPTKDNGIVTTIADKDCEVTDTQGEQIPGTLPGQLTAVCSNATITIRMLEGDLNLDCKVDVKDDQAEAFRYGSTTGLQLYDQWYDLEPASADGDIDIKDLQFVFGRNYSTCENPIPNDQAVPVPPIDP